MRKSKEAELLKLLEHCRDVARRCANFNFDPLRKARYEGKVAAFSQAIGLVKQQGRP